MIHQIITHQWPSIESLAKSKPAICLTLLFGPKCVSLLILLFLKTHMGKQTWWLWWCTSLAGLVSPAHSSPLQPPEWQGHAQGSPASADLSDGLNAGLWNGAELAVPPAGRSEACHPVDAMLKPGTSHGELIGWIQQPGNGRKRSLGPENMPYCPQGRGYVHNAWKEE